MIWDEDLHIGQKRGAFVLSKSLSTSLGSVNRIVHSFYPCYLWHLLHLLPFLLGQSILLWFSSPQLKQQLFSGQSFLRWDPKQKKHYTELLEQWNFEWPNSPHLSHILFLSSKKYRPLLSTSNSSFSSISYSSSYNSSSKFLIFLASSCSSLSSYIVTVIPVDTTSILEAAISSGS